MTSLKAEGTLASSFPAWELQSISKLNKRYLAIFLQAENIQLISVGLCAMGSIEERFTRKQEMLHQQWAGGQVPKHKSCQ